VCGFFEFAKYLLHLISQVPDAGNHDVADLVLFVEDDEVRGGTGSYPAAVVQAQNVGDIACKRRQDTLEWNVLA
jgi:hypothetical protein